MSTTVYHTKGNYFKKFFRIFKYAECDGITFYTKDGLKDYLYTKEKEEKIKRLGFRRFFITGEYSDAINAYNAVMNVLQGFNDNEYLIDWDNTYCYQFNYKVVYYAKRQLVVQHR